MPQDSNYYAPGYDINLRYRNLHVKHQKFVQRTAIVGAVAGLVILALNGRTQTQAKKILGLKTEIMRLDKDLELAWQNVTDNFLAICTILEVVKPSDEQFKEIEADLKQIKSQGR